MSNVLLTNAVIAKEIMSAWHTETVFLKKVNKQYSKEFAKTGAKIGNTINVERPNRYNVQQGPSIVPQGTNESTVPLTLNRYWTVPMSFSGVERVLSIEQFRKKYIQPAVSKMTAQGDLECHAATITGAYPTANSAGSTACPGAGPANFIVGTPGTTPGTSGGSATGLAQYNAPACFLNAGVVLDNNDCPDDGRRSFMLNPAANAASVGALAGLFNPQNIISKQYEKGLMGNALGFDFYRSQNVYSFTAGTRTATGVDTVDTTAAAFATAGTTSSTITYTAGAGNNGKTLVAGDVFNLPNVYLVNPETQQNTGILYPFVVAANITLATGANTVTVSPFKVSGTNIADGTILTASGSSTAAVSFISGAASAFSPQNLVFHEDSCTLGTADLELPQNAGGGALESAARENFEGISMRIVTFWDGMNDQNITRVDLLGGFSVLRPEWIVRLCG